LLVRLRKKPIQLILTKFGGKVTNWRQKNPLDLCSDPHSVALGLGLRLTLRVTDGRATQRDTGTGNVLWGVCLTVIRGYH